MKAPVLLAVAAFVVTLGLSLGTLGSAGYRAAGIRLAARADAIRTGPLREALAGPEAPLPTLIACLGTLAFKTPLRSASAAGAACLALAAAVIALLGWRLAGLSGGLLAAGLFVCTPGTLFHARTLGPEAAITLATTLLLAAATLRHTVRSALLATGALLACLASSNEGVLLAIPWLLAAPLADWPSQERRTGAVRLPPLAPAALVPVLVAPILLFWLWPHLAEDGGKRWLAFLTHPFEAPHPAMVVLGDVRDQAIGRAPSFVMGLLQILTRVPLPVLALATLGAWRVLASGAPLRRASFAVLGLLTVMVVQSIAGGPYYAGTDGVMPMLPFLAVLAGIGGAAILGAVRDLWPRRRPALAAAGVGAALLLPVPIELVRSFPMEPAARSSLVGGTRGAAALGFETRTDSLLPASTVDWLNDALPERARLAAFPQSGDYRAIIEGLKRHGLLRPDIEWSETYAATHVLTPRAPGEPLFASAVMDLGEPLYVLERDGVRLLTVSAF